MKSFQKFQYTSIRDYTPYFFSKKEWESLDKIDWTQEIILEVGSGCGDWILAEALHNPKKIYIAIEKTQEKFEKFFNKYRKGNYANLFPYRADAVLLSAQKIPFDSLNQIFFLYPNPWPKKRQGNKRFFVSPAFQIFDQRLKRNGEIYLASNIFEYVEEAKEALEKNWKYRVEVFQKIPESQEPRTLFEKKYKERGENLFELRARKSA